MSEGFDIRLPNLTEGDAEEQLRQIRSYLYQLAHQLQFALGSGGNRAAVNAAAAELTFPAVKGMLIRSGEVVTRAGYDADREAEKTYIRTGLRSAAGGSGSLRGVEIGCRAEQDGVASLSPRLRVLPEKTVLLDARGQTVAEIRDGQLQMGEYSWQVDSRGHCILT